MGRTRSGCLWVLSMLVGLVACGGCSSRKTDDGHEASCESVCHFHAECEKTCFLDEEPDCSEQENYDLIYSQCMAGCTHGATRLDGACTDAAGALAECLDGRSCADGLGDGCRIEEMRYRELCLDQPGQYVCRSFCVELQVGCLPYSLFGFRGDGCEEACKTSAADLGCLEAHYALDQCTEGMMYACGAWTGDCTTQAASMAELCDAWQPNSADPEEQSFCSAIAPHQCDCGLWSGEDCLSTATYGCLFLLGHGSPCREAMQSFDSCMTSIDACDRDKLRDTCLPEWEAWEQSCYP